MGRRGTNKRNFEAAYKNRVKIGIIRIKESFIFGTRQRKSHIMKEVARLLGVEVRTVYRWMSGESIPSDRQIRLIESLAAEGKRV